MQTYEPIAHLDASSIQLLRGALGSSMWKREKLVDDLPHCINNCGRSILRSATQELSKHFNSFATALGDASWRLLAQVRCVKKGETAESLKDMPVAKKFLPGTDPDRYNARICLI